MDIVSSLGLLSIRQARTQWSEQDEKPEDIEGTEASLLKQKAKRAGVIHTEKIKASVVSQQCICMAQDKRE